MVVISMPAIVSFLPASFSYPSRGVVMWAWRRRQERVSGATHTPPRRGPSELMGGGRQPREECSVAELRTFAIVATHLFIIGFYSAWATRVFEQVIEYPSVSIDRRLYC